MWDSTASTEFLKAKSKNLRRSKTSMSSTQHYLADIQQVIPHLLPTLGSFTVLCQYPSTFPSSHF